jgi:hypothetical protein
MANHVKECQGLPCSNRCPCPCHAPAWLDDASVPDFIPDPLD